MSSQENKELVLRFYETLDKGGIDGLAESIGTDFRAHVMGTTTLDWEGFKQFGGAFYTAFPNGRHVFDRVVADEDNVVTIGTFRGTHTGEMQGIPPTNNRVQVTVIHLDRVVGGKIVEHVGMANEVDIMRQLGVDLVPKGTAS